MGFSTILCAKYYIGIHSGGNWKIPRRVSGDRLPPRYFAIVKRRGVGIQSTILYAARSRVYFIYVYRTPRYLRKHYNIGLRVADVFSSGDQVRSYSNRNIDQFLWL